MPWLRSEGVRGENKATEKKGTKKKKKNLGSTVRKLQTLERNYKCDVMAASLPAAGSKQLPCRLQKYLVLSFVFAVATVRLTILSVLGVVSGFIFHVCAVWVQKHGRLTTGPWGRWLQEEDGRASGLFTPEPNSTADLLTSTRQQQHNWQQVSNSGWGRTCWHHRIQLH